MTWFKLELSFEETKALRAELGDLPKSRTGPWIRELYRRLDARLRVLAGSIDEGTPRLTVVRDVPTTAQPPERIRRKPLKPPPTPPENPCPSCQGGGLLDGAICQACRGFGEVA